MNKKKQCIRMHVRLSGFIPLTKAARWLLPVCLLLMLSQAGTAQSWGQLPAPSEETVLKDLGLFGKIKKAVWSGGNKLSGTEQTLHMAELNFNYPSDYELKIAYVYNDPVASNHPPVSPAECREICYFIACSNPGTGECGTNSLQRFCEPVAGPQFDFVSHVAAKYGAVMATNGAFYDYFYNCVPGVKSYIKIDNTEVSIPNVINHRNEGAFAFDFSGTTPRMTIAGRSATALEQLGSNMYDANLSSYPNVMSGGHLIKNGQPYVLSTPAFCNGITYPWSNSTAHQGPNDPLKKSGKEWRDFACPTITAAANQPVDVPITPSAYGYQNFFKCSNLSDLEKRKQFTCIDYAKYGEEFGGSTGLAKRSRTFLGQKGNKFYWIVADGCLTKVNTPNGEAQCKGFTIEELGDFAAKMGFDKLLNFDGGSSSAFYLAGKGILQFQYDPGSAPSVVRVGPQGQRLLQSVLMLVPKRESLSTVYSESLMFNYASITNSTTQSSTSQPISYIDLTPAVDKFSGNAGMFGKFRTNPITPADGTYKDVGQILISYVRDAKGPLTKGFVAGIGRMPEKLRTTILSTGRGLGINARGYDEFQTQVSENKLKYWAVAFFNGKVVAYDIYPKSFDERWFRYDAPEPMDGNWHSFMIQGTRHSYFSSNSPLGSVHQTDFRFFIDNYNGNSSLYDKDETVGSLFNPGGIFTEGVNSVTIGAMVNDGKFYAGDVNGAGNGPAQVTLDVQDYLFSKNFDNYYNYSESDIEHGWVYGDPEDEYDYYKSHDWTSDTYDELHANQVPYDDGNTIFCFDEKAGSRMLYAWYRVKDGDSRTYKAHGTYVNNVVPVERRYFMKRDVHETPQFARGMYKLVNFANSTLMLSAYFNPSTDFGHAFGATTSWAAMNDDLNRTNTFLVEEMAGGKFLISKPGIFTLKYGGANSPNPVVTTMDLDPGNADIYWDIQSALTENTFYIKHRATGKYMTCGADGVNITLNDFNPNDHYQVWTLERAGEAQRVIQPNYYKVRNLDDGGAIWTFSGLNVSVDYPDTDNSLKGFWLDYIGADFYRMKRQSGPANSFIDISSPESTQSVIRLSEKNGQATASNANVHIKIHSNEEVEFQKRFILNSNLVTFKIHNYYDFSSALGLWVAQFTSADWPGDNGLESEGFKYSDVTFNLELQDSRPPNLASERYQLSSLANQQLVGTNVNGQILATSGANAAAHESHTWEFTSNGLGTYYIGQPGVYTKVVDGTMDGNIKAWATTTNISERSLFNLIRNSDGSVSIEFEGRYLTDKGDNQGYLFRVPTGENDQKFLLYLNKSHEFSGLNRGFYKIINKASSKAVLDNMAGDPTNSDVGGYVVQSTYQKDGDFKDEWLVEPIGNNEYLISNRKSLHSLDVKDLSSQDNLRMWTYALSKTKAQRFKLKTTGDGFFQIQNVASQKCVDLNNIGLADGEYLKQLSCRTLTDQYVDAQKFSFEWIEDALRPIELEGWYNIGNSSTGGAGGLGILPLTFNDNDIIKYGDFQHINKSDLWSFVYRGAQLYTIQLKGSKKLLTISNTSSASGGVSFTPVVQRQLSVLEERDEQYWALTANLAGNIAPAGNYYIVSPKKPASSLQLINPGSQTSAAVGLTPSVGHTWTLTPVKEPTVEGSFYIYSYDQRSALRTRSSSSIIGVSVTPTRFNFELQGDGYYKIMDPDNNVVMAANDGGSDVVKASWNANDTKQRWSIEYTPTNGQYRIINKAFSTAVWNDFIENHDVKLVGWADYGDRKYQLLTSSVASSFIGKAAPATPEVGKASSFTVFPNPTRGDITITLPASHEPGLMEYYFELFDMTGRRVYSTRRTTTPGSALQLNNLKAASGAKSGVYILKATSTNGQLLGAKSIVIL